MIDLHAVCGALPGSTRTYPFGEDAAVYKVGGRIFALTQDEPTTITLKGEPPDVTGLVETYDAVTRGFHMNKKHWITVRLDGDVLPDLLAELVEDSYDPVVDRLPARDRP